MDGNLKQPVFGVCVALLVLGAFVGAASAARGGTEDMGSIRAVDEGVKSFYDDTTIAYHRVMPFGHQISDDETLAHKKHISFYKHQVLKPKLNKQIIRSAGIEESDYTFSLNGNAELLWKYENKKEDSYVYLVWIGDVDGDEVSDGIVVDSWIDIDDDGVVDGWSETGKLFLMSGKTGFSLWNRSYDRQIEIAGSIGDEDGGGVDDVIIYSESNNELAVDMELISGIDGDTLWSKTITPTGLYCTGYAWGDTHENDLNGDLVNDMIFGWYCWEEDISLLQAISGKDGSKIWQSKIFEGDLWGCIPCELPDLNGDGTGDYVTSGYSYDTDRGCVTALSGKDGSEIWSRSITGDPWTVPYFDFNKDGIVDVVVEGDDWNNGTVSIFIVDGRNGGTIWSRSYNSCARVDCWLYDDIDDDGVYDLVVGSDTVQMLSGATGDAIWEKDYAASAGTCRDIDGDGKNDVLAVSYTQIDSHNYLYNVTALSGINGNEIWENSFMHHVEAIPPEGVWNNTYCCAFSHSWSDQNGDGVPDPYLDIDYHWSYWNESVSEQDEYSALKFIMIDGSNGGEMWDAEITSTGWNGVYHTDFGYDFDDDGVNDTFINTQSGMYAVKTSGADTSKPVHNLNTGEDFAAIQDAIDDANTLDGHTITVDAGTHNEIVDVSVTKSLTIRSTSGNPEDTIVQAKNSDDCVFWVTADYVNISGFTVEGAIESEYDTKYGIFLNETNQCAISNNIASNNSIGIILYYSNNNTVANNTASNNYDCGIWSRRSNNNIFINNTASNNAGYDGFFLVESDDNILINNSAVGNNRNGICFGGDNNILTNNIVSNNNEYGIAPAGTNHSLSNNIVSNNFIGIYIEHCLSNSTITGNSISNNDYCGIYFYTSSNNSIYLNNFINNSVYSVYLSESSTNIWNSTEKITYTYSGDTFTNYLGNYWDDYVDIDVENDGIWDHSYSINDDDTDYHPLVEGFENYKLEEGFSIILKPPFTYANCVRAR